MFVFTKTIRLLAPNFYEAIVKLSPHRNFELAI